MFTNNQNHVGLRYSVVGVSALGVEAVLATSTLSTLITVVSPNFASYPMIITLSPFVDIAIRLYINSNVGTTRTGSIEF